MRGVSVVVCLLLCLCACVTSSVWERPFMRAGADPEAYDGVALFSDREDDYAEDQEMDYYPEGNVILSVIREPVDERTEPLTPESPEQDGLPESETPDASVPDPDTITVEELAEKLDKLMSEVKAQQDVIAELEKSNNKLLHKIDFIEQQAKTNSLIFLNMRESKQENYKVTLQKVLHVINRIMKVRASPDDIAVALRANSNYTQQNRPVIVRFTNFATKMKVLRASGRLSGSDIEVAADYSERVAEIRRQLLPYVQAARKHGHHAFLLYDRAVVNGLKMTLEELQAQKPADKGCPDQESAPGDQVEEVEVEPDHQDHEEEE